MSGYGDGLSTLKRNFSSLHFNSHELRIFVSIDQEPSIVFRGFRRTYDPSIATTLNPLAFWISNSNSDWNDHALFLTESTSLKMSSVTHFLNEVGTSKSNTSDRMLVLVYRELRQLAEQRLRCEAGGQTLQATALVHEAYLRLMGAGDVHWQNRAHFFAAASEAMRRISVETYRRKNRVKRGKGFDRVNLDLDQLPNNRSKVDLPSIDEALIALESADPQKALLVKLRFFAGMTMPEAAEILQVSLPTAERYWRYARAFLACQLSKN